MKKTKYYVALLFSTLIISFSFLFIKIALNYASMIDILAHRFIIASLSAALFAKVSHKQKVSLQSLKQYAHIALAYPIIFFTTQIIALSLISSSEAGIIQALSPVFTLVLAHLYLKETTNYKQIIAIFLSVMGVLLIVLMNGISIENFSLLGTLVMFVSTIFSSIYAVLVRKSMQEDKDASFTLSQNILFIGTLFFSAIALLFHISTSDISHFFTPFTHANYLVAILFLGVLSSLLTSLLSAYAHSEIKANVSGVFGSLTTVITLLIGVFILKEHLYYYHYLGAFIIIAGVYGASYFKTEEKNPEH